MLEKLKSYFRECHRVLVITKKPTNLEFKTTVKIAGIGLLLIGFLGFVIQYIASFIRGA